MEKEEFLKLLPKLILEDDQVKGAIITALSGVVSTKEDIRLVIQEFDKRFEAMDKRFEALQIQINTNYNELRSAIDTMGSRSGRSSEKMIIRLLRENNKLKEIDISNIEQKEIIDEEGIIFPKGYRTDIDVLVENGKTILIEIKFRVDNRDLYHFVQVAKLYEKLYKKPDELWVLTFEISPKTLATSTKFPVKVIYGREK
ncbi:MAG: hypothetical protein ACTSR8_11235 [Promethearchaeota archaeon]